MLQLNDSLGIGDKFAEELLAGNTLKRRRRRDDLDNQVQQFLARGGKIQQIPTGVSAHPTRMKRKGNRYVDDPDS